MLSVANAVKKQLDQDFPEKDTAWVLSQDVSWRPVSAVPLARINFANEKQWNAYGHSAKLKMFTQKIRRGDRKPVVLAQIAGDNTLTVLDGHHRALAYKQLNLPVRGYIANVGPKSAKAALEMHASQRSGNSGPVKDRPLKFSNLQEAIELTPMTAVSSTVQNPFAKSAKPGLWNVPGLQLAPYIQNVAHALLRNGRASTESDAIHMAYGIVKRWAQGKGRNGKPVHPDVQAAAARNIAIMDANRMKAHMKHGTAITLAKPDPLAAMDFHQVPAAMRKVRNALRKNGVPEDQVMKQVVQLFTQWASGKNAGGGSVPPVTQEAAVKVLQAYARRKKWSKDAPGGRYSGNIVHGKKHDQAGGDTGYSFKDAHFSNEHHDGDGKFAPHAAQRARVLREFQSKHSLPVTGTMDEETSALLRTMNKAVKD